MPAFDDAYEQLYRDAKGHDRTCLNCGRLRREANTRPSDAYFADSYRSSIGAAYTGEEPRDRRHTAVDGSVGVFCEDCGTTDSHTLVASSETLSTGAVLGRLEDVLATVDELLDVTLTPTDCDHAVDAVKQAKQDPEWTNEPAATLVAFGVAFAVQRATYRLEDRFVTPSAVD